METFPVSYEFEKEYHYSVEVPVFDELGRYTDDTEIVDGYVKFFGDAEWDEAEQWYVLSTFWTDYGNNFSDIGEAPDGTEEQFMEDFKDYLKSQGVSGSNIEHY